MTTPDTLRTLLDQATPGPWEIDGPHHIFAPQDYDVLVTHPDENNDRLRYEYICTDSTEADARLIAAAPTHLADLITALEQIEQVKSIHQMELRRLWVGAELRAYCGTDGHPYPCPTIRILDGNE